MLTVLLALLPVGFQHHPEATGSALGCGVPRVAREVVGQAGPPSDPSPRREVRNGLIAYADRRSGPVRPMTHGAQLFVIGPDGEGKRQLTDSAGGNYLPAWSPDGRKIAFVSTRTGAAEIWVMDADGSNQTQLTLGGGNMLPAWSPDGQSIACVSQSSRTPQIWMIGADGTNPHQLTHQGLNRVPTWSPGGEQIAFWRGNNRGFGQIWVMNADGSDPRQLTFPRTDPYTPHGSSANAPAWLYSDQIAYWSGIEHRYGQIWVMDGDGSNQRQLTSSPAPISNDNPTWSPDGAQILFDTSRRGRPEVWVMDVDGRNQRPVISDVRVVPARVSWQPVLLDE